MAGGSSAHSGRLIVTDRALSTRFEGAIAQLTMVTRCEFPRVARAFLIDFEESVITL